MKEVFQEYGGVIVTIIAILSLIAVIAAVIGTGEDGIIGSAFSDLIFTQQFVSIFLHPITSFLLIFTHLG